MRFNDIYMGKDALRTAQEHNSFLSDPKKFEDLFFNAHQDIIERWSAENIGNQKFLYTVKYKLSDREVCIFWGPLKTSGIPDNDHKRIQIGRKTPLREETPHFAIGSYFTGDSDIYVLITGSIREFIANARNGSTYSSLWVEYPSLWTIYKEGEHTWQSTSRSGTQRTMYGCKSDLCVNIHKKILLALGVEENKLPFKKEKVLDPEELIDFTEEIGQYSDHEQLPRNPLFKDIAVKNAGYRCELCGTSTTFTDRENKEYFEGHHIIMYNPRVQRRFRHCLDHPQNIACLCPECHRKIHHSPEADTEAMVTKLFEKHHNLLKMFAIKIKDLKEIINDYMNYHE